MMTTYYNGDDDGDAGAGYDSYLWSTGETTQTIEVTESGEYSVEVNLIVNNEEIGQFINGGYLFYSDTNNGISYIASEDYIGGESFAVLLGDTICVGQPNCTKGLVDIFEKKKSSVFAVEKIKPEETRRYGISCDLKTIEIIIDIKNYEIHDTLIAAALTSVFISCLSAEIINSSSLTDDCEISKFLFKILFSVCSIISLTIVSVKTSLDVSV